MSKTRLVTIIVTLGALFRSNTIQAQQKPEMREMDRVRLAEAFRLGEAAQEQIWPGWSNAPFCVLLVTPDWEFLVRHPSPGEGFLKSGYDNLLMSDVYYRKRIFPTRLQATFPAVGGISTIVVGQPEETESKTSTRWVVVLLHEHFHQMQDSYPGINAEMDSLKLSRGDQSGGWMLNFPFPYKKSELDNRFGELAQKLREAIEAQGQKDFTAQIKEYIDALKRVEGELDKDYLKYMSFQNWKEGVARYTELRVAQWAEKNYEPSEAFQKLPDYSPFRDDAAAMKARILKELGELDLAKSERVSFYPLGAGEAILLDLLKPGWQKRYWAEKFNLEKFLQ